MARIAKTELRTPRTLLSEQVFCDWCDKEIKPEPFKVLEGSIELLRTGYGFPEGGNVETIKADLCESCFKIRLIPFLESNGCKLRTEESDW